MRWGERFLFSEVIVRLLNKLSGIALILFAVSA